MQELQEPRSSLADQMIEIILHLVFPIIVVAVIFFIVLMVAD